MIWRCTMYINGLVDGWSESVYHKDEQANPGAVAGAFEQIITKRVRFLGAPYQVVAYKITAYSTNIGGRPANRAHYFLRKTFPVPRNTFDAEPGNVGCEIIMQDPTLAVSTRLTFGAPPDDCVTMGGQVNAGVVPPGAPANFNTLVQDYINALTAVVGSAPNWGWAAVGTPQDRGITRFTALPSGQVQITPDVPLVPPLTAGVQYPARIRSVNRGKSNLNGPLIVVTAGDGTAFSASAIALGPSNVGGRIKLYPPVRGYTQYGSGVMALQSVKHTRGRPFGISRGRRPVKPRA